MYFVYVLKSSVAQKSYVGMTDNLDRRLKQHNSGLHPYTKRYVPWSVVHEERYDTLSDARKREKYLKSAVGRRFLSGAVFGNK